MEKLSHRQWKHWDVLERLRGGQLTTGEAAQVLGLSRRWVRSLRRAVEKRGVKVLIHGNTGRRPKHALREEVRARIIRLRRTRYDGFNDQHLTEKLVEVEGIEVSRATVQRLLRGAGVGPGRRRDRKPQAGMMILWDGSRHDWLEGRGPMWCLMGAIDDATSELLPGAHFVDQECSAGYLRVLKAIAQEKGLPLSAYMDRHGALRRNDDHWTLKEELKGEREPTQVERALKALGIEIIYALTPQAKGRVERLWGTLQDRLVSELRLAGARTVEEANRVLERYRPEHNRRFAVAPQDATPAWRPVRAGLDLERACSFFYERVVQNDHTVKLEGRLIDIPPGPGQRSYAKARAEVRQLLDGSWRVYLQDRLIAKAPGTNEVSELPTHRPHQRSASWKTFRKALQTVAAALP